MIGANSHSKSSLRVIKFSNAFPEGSLAARMHSFPLIGEKDGFVAPILIFFSLTAPLLEVGV